MSYFFSEKDLGFFNAYVNEDIPSDAIEITDETYHSLLDGQSRGKVISSDTEGNPLLVDPVIDWSERAESQRKSLLVSANSTTADWRTELELGVITDDDKASLIKWMAYIKALKTLVFASVTDETGYNDIEWPIEPDSKWSEE